MDNLHQSFLDIDDFIAQGMGPDLHWFPVDVSPSCLATVLVGMANMNGGTVLLGVAPRSGKTQGAHNTGDSDIRIESSPTNSVGLPCLAPAD